MNFYRPRKINDQSKEILEPALKNASDRLSSDEFGIMLHDLEGIYTITTVFLEEMVRVLANAAEKNGGEARIILHTFGTFGVKYRQSDDGEKAGNLTAYSEAGPDFKQAIKNDGLTEIE